MSESESDDAVVLGADGWQCVLTHLPCMQIFKAKGVCKDFLAACVSALATMQRLDMRDEMLLPDHALAILFSRLGQLKTLILASQKFAPASYNQLTYNQPSLTHLDLSETRIDNSHFAAIWFQLKCLKHLDVDNCNNLDDGITQILEDYALRGVYPRNENPTPAGPIATLSIASLNPSFPFYLFMLGSCKSLTELNVSGYDEIDAEKFSYILAGLPLLRSLRAVESEKLTEEGCKHWGRLISLRNPDGLRHLDLSWCEQIGMDGVRALLDGCPKLEDLLLRSCTSVNAAETIHALHLSANDELRMLNLNRCDGALPEPPLLFAHKDGSQTYYLGDGTSLEDEAMLTEPSRWLSKLRALPSLTWLDVGWLMELVDDSGVALLLSNLPQLRVLSIEGCKQLSDAALSPLIETDEEEDEDDEALRRRYEQEEESGRPSQPGAALIRLNASWVDNISNKTLHAALRATARHDEARRRGKARVKRPSRLLALDYYGAVWGLDSETRQPVRCGLHDDADASRLLPHALSGWVAAFDGAEEEQELQ